MEVNTLLASLDMLVLERLPDRRFVPRCQLPPWCHALPAQALQAERPCAIEEVFPFLDTFLPQAEACWSGSAPPRVFSDFWCEAGTAGEELHLEAMAARLARQEVLLISRNERFFAQQQLVLQRARELRLANGALMREMEQEDVLMHTIVHDLAAPLQAIFSALALLQELTPGGEGREWTEVALQAAQRQQQLIGEILDIFRIERGLEVPEAQAPDLYRHVREVMAEFEPAALVREVRLQTRLEGDSCRVIGEGSRLSRVLANLVDNALRQSPHGGLVRVTAGPVEAGTVSVTVEDEGPGVPAEQLPHLFEKFARGREHRAGTGLGLYFCRITAESWGGAIGYEPGPGAGARFWLRLPVAQHMA
jgi:signal transduction histidine kinase